MGFLGDVVGNAVDAYKGGPSQTGLQTFLGKFSSPGGAYVDTLDPLGTFDVRFKFYPSLSLKELKKKGKQSTFSRVTSSIGNSLKTGLSNAADSLTGGLFSSVTKGESLKDAHDKFKDAHRHTFMEYLAKANLMQTGEQWQNDDTVPLVLNLGPYVQAISIPQLQIETGKGSSIMGSFPVTQSYGVHSGDSLSLTVVNTKAALHERIFYPWMRETTLPYWSYDTQPYTTATVTVDFSKHNDAQYVFCGCRPSSIDTMQATQAPDSSNLTRKVTLVYDMMFVTSNLDTVQSAGGKLADAAGGLLGGVGKMLNL
jgi:hypothetical protein